MAYISLYRKYRPQTFEDVVGQEHVTTTLRNAITEGRIASGYLFTGTRGTAKTTCARILAKALNCIGPDGSLTAPTPEPCGVCGPCQSIAASNFVDVLEMDAASHGKVDDVRDLVASIKFPPMEGRYKVYIIDEAHQLSRDAMDAFLKTLEEPPAQVVFILATTELEKLPITIASRCQVFEFKRGSVPQIAGRLMQVLETEGVAAEPAAVTLVARAADGSYRDSLSLLEQVLAYKRTGITVKDTTTVLGTIDEDILNRVICLVAASDAAGAFASAGEILESGKDVRQFLKSLSARVRDLLFVGVGATPISAGDMDDSPELRRQAALFSPAALMNALEILTDAEQETKRSSQHRLLLEMTLLKLMRLPQSASGPAPYIAAPTPVATVLPHAAAPKTSPTITEVSPVISDDGNAEFTLPSDDDLDIPPLEDEPVLLDLATPAFDDTLSLLVTSADEHDAADDFMQVQQVAEEERPANGHKPDPVSADAPEELIQLQKAWQEVINRMGSRSASGAVLVKDAKPVALNGHTFTLEFQNPLFVDKLEKNEKGSQALADIISKTLGADAGAFKVKAILQGTALAAKAAPRTAPQASQSARAPDPQHSPFLDQVIAVFGGQIIDDTDTKGQ